MKLVLIRWLDAVSDDSGWKKVSHVAKQSPPLVKSVGWVIRRTKTKITLAASLVHDDCDGDVTIPIGMVRSITELREMKP